MRNVRQPSDNPPPTAKGPDNGNVLPPQETGVSGPADAQTMHGSEPEYARELIEHGRVRATSLLAGGFAGMINNLMGVIKGNVELLKREQQADNSSGDRIWTIEQSAKRAARMADKIAASVRTVNGDSHPLQVNALLDDTLALSEYTLPSGVHLVRVLRAAPDIVRVDAGALQQAVLHLLEFSVEAMRGHEGSIYVSSSNMMRPVVEQNGRKRPRTRAHVSITVRDEGPGMGEELKGQLFDLTAAHGDSVTPNGPAIAKLIVERMNGTLELESDPGIGSTFRILLPVEKVAETTSAAEQMEDKPGKGTVLVVDDEQGIREVLISLLKSVGYTVIGAENGRVALEQCRLAEGGVDLVLLDLLMPEMDGTTTFEHLHRDFPDVPVILVSGYDNDEHIASLINRGARTFIQKPFELDHVLREVNGVMGDLEAEGL